MEQIKDAKARKNLDYSASAVNLTHAEPVAVQLRYIRTVDHELADLKAQAEAYVPQELKDRISTVNAYMAEANAKLRAMVDEQGSYQDLQSGLYAVKQRKVSKSYSAEQFEATYPQYAPAIIIKAVDTAKLNGLIKGGLVSEDALKRALILTESETYAYIVRY